MTIRELASEIIQAIIAIFVLVPTAYILIYQVQHGLVVGVPNMLATLDGAIIAFYFRGVVVRSTQTAVNGAVAAAATGGTR